MYRIAFIVTLGLLVGCQGNTQLNVTDSCEIDGVELRLIQDGTVAVLEVSNGNKKLEGTVNMDPPCYFIREEGNVIQFTYADDGIDNVVAIIGNMLDQKTLEEEGVEKGAVCGDMVQGIVVKGDRIILTENILEDGIICKDIGMDEMEYWMLSH